MSPGPVILTRSQAANPSKHLPELEANPESKRALTSPLGAGTFAVCMDDESMRGNDERELSELNSWQKGDLMIFIPYTSNTKIEPGQPVIATAESEDEAIIRLYKPLQGTDFALVPLNSFYSEVVVDDNNPGQITGVLKRSQREKDQF